MLELASSEYAMDNGIGLVIVSNGDFSKLENDYYSRYGAFRNLTHLQAVDGETLEELYGSCVALLMPSFYEGFGLPAAEASAARCLVIGANTSSLPGVLGTDQFLFCPTDIAKGIETLAKLDDTALVRKTISIQSRAVKDLRWSKIAKCYQEIYED